MPEPLLSPVIMVKLVHNRKLLVSILVTSLLTCLISHGAVPDSTLGEYLRLGQYDAVIEQTTQISPEALPPTTHYLRGMAYWNLGQFSSAAADFEKSGNYAPWNNWANPSEYLRKYSAVKKTLPAQSHRIMQGDRIQFQVYYDTMTPWVETIIANLPKASAIGNQLFHTEMPDSSVYIFASRKQFGSFHRAWLGMEPQPWQYSGGASGVLLFADMYLDAPRGSQQDYSNYLQSLIAHEYTHSIIQWRVGSIPTPRWFEEGLAMYAGSQASPNDIANNDAQMRRLIANNGLLSYANLNSKFYESYAASCAGREKTNSYEQGLSMVRYLLTVITTDQLADMLQQIREEQNFDKAFAHTLDITPEAFYAAWYQSANDRYSPNPHSDAVGL